MKTIHATLLTHLGQPVTTTCLLVKVECVGFYAGTVLGFTNLDIDVAYNDGAGSVTYESENGFTPKRLAATSGSSVDNTELDGVISDGGVTEAMVRAGLFDSAKVTIYRVNYNDLTSGRHEIVHYGRAGETKYTEMGWRTEFRSLSQLLKQPIGQRYSTTCRAQFGDARCTKAFSWTSGTVTSVGTETAREFSDTSIVSANGYYNYGVVEWLTGANTGAQMDVDVYTVGSFDLLLDLPFPIVIGDTYRVRLDCTKTFEYCDTVHSNTDWFRGENLIPVDGTAMVPNAEIKKAGKSSGGGK